MGTWWPYGPGAASPCIPLTAPHCTSITLTVPHWCCRSPYHVSLHLRHCYSSGSLTGVALGFLGVWGTPIFGSRDRRPCTAPCIPSSRATTVALTAILQAPRHTASAAALQEAARRARLPIGQAPTNDRPAWGRSWDGASWRTGRKRANGLMRGA